MDELAGYDDTIGLGGGTVSRTDSENACKCFRIRRVAIGGDAVLNLLRDSNYDRLPFFAITAIEAPVAVHEPASLALLLVPMGAAGVVAVRRRSRG